MDTAVHADEGARARQSVRNIPRKGPALTLDSDKEYLKNALATDNLRRPKFESREQRELSEWLTTVLRHKPVHRGSCQTYAFVKLRLMTSTTALQIYRRYSTHGPQKDTNITTLSIST
eukprot:9137818-Pyramimonas_sp.AAC.1